MMDFITIDFETATPQRNSPCEIGLTFVENNEIINTKSWLIKPIYKEFNYFNKKIHGITEGDVVDALDFKELWVKELKGLLENKFLIAHNASFDMSVLRKTLETYDLDFPKLDYSCSYIFSKRVWENLPAYDLKTVCEFNNISFKHHRAGSDAEATAQLTIKAFEKMDIKSKTEFSEKLKVTIGSLFEGGYNASTAKKERKARAK